MPNHPHWMSRPWHTGLQDTTDCFTWSRTLAFWYLDWHNDSMESSELFHTSPDWSDWYILSDSPNSYYKQVKWCPSEVVMSSCSRIVCENGRHGDKPSLISEKRPALMAQLGEKTSFGRKLTVAGWIGEPWSSVHTDQWIYPSGLIHLISDVYKKYLYKKDHISVCNQKTGTDWFISSGESLYEHCPMLLFRAPLPAAAVAIPQHTADKAAPGSWSSLHTGSPPGWSAQPLSGQGTTKVQRGHGGPHITSCTTWFHLGKFFKKIKSACCSVPWSIYRLGIYMSNEALHCSRTEFNSSSTLFNTLTCVW